MTESDSKSTPSLSAPSIGRNEPCPCGGGKKYKRCHGVDAAPKLGTPSAALRGASPELPPGMDQASMLQFAQAFQKLPKGQLQRLQSIMQKAMAGKDVTEEAGEFEKALPLEFQNMLQTMPTPLPPAEAGEGQEPEKKGLFKGLFKRKKTESGS